MKRIAYIDLIKILTIFLVVLGHSTICHGFPKQLIYAFHMPVFFALFGLTYSLERHHENGFLTVDYVKKKFKRLMLPAFIWAAGYSMIASIVNDSFSFTKILNIVYLSQASLRQGESLTSIWFLPCMFLSVTFAELLFGFFYRYSQGFKSFLTYVALSIFLLPCITFFLPRAPHGYPWCLNLVPLATAMIMIGYLAAKSFDLMERNVKKRYVLDLIVLSISFVFLCISCKINLHFISGNNVDMASAKFGNPLLYMVCSISGLFMMMGLCKLISPDNLSTPLSFIGENTLAIFLLHKPLIVGIGNIMKSHGQGNIIMALISSMVVLIVCAVGAFFINRLCPQLIGNSRFHREISSK